MTSNLIPYHRGTYFKIGFNGLLVTSALINEILDANFSRTKNSMELKTSKAVYFIFLDVPLPGKSSDFVGHAKFDFGILQLAERFVNVIWTDPPSRQRQPPRQFLIGSDHRKTAEHPFFHLSRNACGREGDPRTREAPISPYHPPGCSQPGGVGFQLTITWRLSDYYIFYLFDRERLKPLNPGKRRSIPLDFPNFRAEVTLT